MSEDDRSEQVIDVHEPRRVGVVVSVRLKPDEVDLLEMLSETAGRSQSETLRVALHTLASTPSAPSRSVGRPEDFEPATSGGYLITEPDSPVLV